MSTGPSLGQRHRPAASCGPSGRLLRVSEPRLPPQEGGLVRSPCRAAVRAEDVGQATHTRGSGPSWSTSPAPWELWNSQTPTLPLRSQSHLHSLSEAGMGWSRKGKSKASGIDSIMAPGFESCLYGGAACPWPLSLCLFLQQEAMALLRRAPSDPGELVKRIWKSRFNSGPPLHFTKEPGCPCAPVLRRPACQSGLR